MSISDYDGRKVGVRVGEGRDVSLFLAGETDNTFTGDVRIGSGHRLYVQKDYGKKAIQGDLYLGSGSRVNISHGGQLSRKSNVILDNSRISLGLSDTGSYDPIEESFNSILVEGDSSLSFHFNSSNSSFNGFSSIVIKDLWIKEGGLLRLEDWEFGYGSRLLVRKDSVHLKDSLGRIRFHENKKARAGLEEYDRDYWKIIPAFPEPSAYGAALGVVGIGLFVWRRKRSVQ